MDSVSNKGKAHKGSKSNHRSALAPLSPQSMSAEFEQLDAIANLAGGADGDGVSVTSSSSGSRITRKIRNVKQPVSYKEPSTGSKLRRGVSRLEMHFFVLICNFVAYLFIFLFCHLRRTQGCIISKGRCEAKVPTKE